MFSDLKPYLSFVIETLPSNNQITHNCSNTIPNEMITTLRENNVTMYGKKSLVNELTMS